MNTKEATAHEHNYVCGQMTQKPYIPDVIKAHLIPTCCQFVAYSQADADFFHPQNA